MKEHKSWIVIPIVLLLFSQCGKKEKEEEKVVVRPEGVDATIVLPRASWQKSLTVFPVENKTTKVDAGPVSLEMAEKVCTDLSAIVGLRIHALTSDESSEKVTIGTDYLLKSSLEQKGGQALASFSLIDAKNDAVLWNGSYASDFEGLLEIPERIIKPVSQTLMMTVDEKRIAKNKIIPSGMVTPYLEGKNDLAGDKREDVDNAVRNFRLALQVDSTYAPAWMGLAESYLKINIKQWDQNRVWLSLAQQAGFKAMQLDSTLAGTHVLMGQIYVGWGDLKQAEKEFKKGLDLCPNSDEAWTGLGKIYSHFGLYEPALESYGRALAIHPADVQTAVSRAMILIGLRQYALAETELNRLLLYHPGIPYIHSFLALVNYYQNDLKKAAKDIQLGMDAVEYRAFTYAVAAMIDVKEGRLDNALEKVEMEVKPYVGNNGAFSAAVAADYVLLNRNGEAMQWLNKALSFEYKDYPWIANDPNFDGIRNDERFVKTMEELKKRWEENVRQYFIK